MRPVLATSLLLLLVLSSSFIQSAIADTAAGPPIPAPSIVVVLVIIITIVRLTVICCSCNDSCESMCGARCAKAGYQKRCVRYCMICCNDCKCVPSGTYGNKSECPCYRDKKNSKGTSKCP